MINPMILCRLSIRQQKRIQEIEMEYPEIDIDELGGIIAEEIFKPALVVPALLEAVEIMGPFAVDKGQLIWHYSSKDGVWKDDGEAELTRRVEFCTGDRYRANQVQQVASLLRVRIPQILNLGNKSYLNLKNGMLNWKTCELVPHDPMFFSIYQINAKWDPQATCPTIDAWMNETFEPEVLPLMWQVIGVVIHPDMGFQKTVVLLGDGYNGKGTFLKIPEALLPKSARTSVDPGDFGSDRFASSDLFLKTANICGDIEGIVIESTSKLKQLTGNDVVSAQRKFRDRFDFLSQATLLFAANKMPPSPDTSLGWMRRWLIIPMTKTIEGGPDATLSERMALELDGAVVKAVQGLQNAMAKGAFDEPRVCSEALEDYKNSSDSSVMFINERLDFSVEHKVPISRAYLYDRYIQFSKERRLPTDSMGVFWGKVEHNGHFSVRTSHIYEPKKERAYIGLKITSSYGGTF